MRKVLALAIFMLSAIVAGSLYGGGRVLAQTIARLYGTTSAGAQVPVLGLSSGALSVSASGLTTWQLTPSASPADCAGGTEGKYYYDSTLHAFLYCNGSVYANTVPSSALSGTTTNDSASAGYLGEYSACQTLAASPVSLTTATGATICSMSLTAGDWDLTGTVGYTAAGTTVVTALQQGVSIVAATIGAQGTYTIQDLGLTGPSNDPTVNTPRVRVSLAATSTVYLIAVATFSVSTLAGYGDLSARRVR